MDPHVHLSAVHMFVGLLVGVAVYGTLHLLALAYSNRATTAWLALGF